LPRTALWARHDGDAALTVARQHLGRRVAEAVAVTGLEHRDAGLHGVEESGAG